MKQTYRDLIVWQRAIELVALVYQATATFPREELFGLVSQMRRAAVSIPCNIAEGQGRLTKGEFLQFLGHSKGSLMELETQTIISRNLGFLNLEATASLEEKAAEVGRLLNGLISSLRSAN